MTTSPATSLDLTAWYDLIRRETRSALQYAADSEPIVGSEADADIVTQLRGMAQDERRAVENLSDWLDQQRQPVPPLGSYPLAFTAWNYLTVRALLSRVIADHRRLTDQLQRDRDRLATDAESAARLDELAALKDKHGHQLQALLA